MFLFFDTETIRVNNTPRIIQMGWILTDDNGVELRSQCFIVRPDDFNIPSKVTGTRRVTSEVARRSGMKIGAVLDAFSKDVAAAEVLIAHNAHFDKNVICDELLRAGHGDILAGKVIYCTMRSSIYFCKIRKRRGYKWPSLEELHISLFDDTFDNVHNALSDARACANCFFELRRRGALFDPLSDGEGRPSGAYEQLTFEDQDRLDELETLNEFLGRSEKKWVGLLKAYFRKTNRLSEKQRAVLSRIRVKAEDRV